MTSKTIYLIRHGETDLNRYGIIQGRSQDPSLNACGRSQAEAFFRTYKAVPFDAVYTSTLKRSIESVQSFVAKGIPHHTLSGLDEIDWGHHEGRKIVPEDGKQYRELVEKWGQGQTHICIEGGESPVQVAKRQRVFITTLPERSDEKTILVCMHGRAMRILLCQLLNYPLSKMDAFAHANLSLYMLRCTEGCKSEFRMSKSNDTTHLKAICNEPLRSK